MNATELQALLANMPLAEDAKKEIMDRQAAGDPPEKILELIDAKLEAVGQDIVKDDPELAAEYNKLEEEYAKEVVAAADEFDKEMAVIDAEANSLGAELDKEIDQARMAELKEEQGKLGS